MSGAAEEQSAWPPPAPILVLGGSGQLGFELVRALAPLGPVHAPGREALDLADRAAVHGALRAIRPGIVVNAAAYTAVDDAEREPGVAHRVNGEAAGVLASEAARVGAILVHYSTDYVFAGDATRPYREDDATGPPNAYGASKLAGERAIADAGGRWLVLRTAWLYGARGRNFLATMLRLGEARDEVRVVDDQRGTPTSARYLAAATAAILGHPRVRDPARAGADAAGPWGVYHLAAGGDATWHDFAAAIFAAVAARGGRVPRLHRIATHEHPSAARRPAYSVLDTGRARRTFGLHVPDWRVLLAHVLAERL